ncbi:MAG: type 1 glutamine amidotransferase, partial [Flavobacteriales bacterium]
ESELFEPLNRLKEEGANVQIISLKEGSIKGMKDHEWSKEIQVDHVVTEVSADDFHGLLLPGGVINPDALRGDENAVAFVRDFFKQGKPVAAICHGPQTLIDAEVVEGRKMTSYSSIKKDLINAGANWVDEEVVVDQGLVTSRSPADLPAFNDKMVEEFAEGVHEEQHA